MSQSKYLQWKLQEYLFASTKLTADFIIAKTMLDRLSDFPHVYLKEIAHAAQVDESTVTKFCNKLGFHGFKELREELIHNDDVAVVNTMLTALNTNSLPTAINAIAIEEKQIMQTAFNQFDFDKIQEMATLLTKSRSGIILAPVYMSESIAFFEELMRRKDINLYRMQRNADPQLIEQCLATDSVVLLFSLKGGWVDTNQETIQLIKNQGGKIILFTATDISPPDIDLVFKVGDEDTMSNQTALLMFMYFKCLFLAIASRC